MADQSIFELQEEVLRRGQRAGPMRQTGTGAGLADWLWSGPGMAATAGAEGAVGSLARTGKDIRDASKAGGDLARMQQELTKNPLRRALASPMLRGLTKKGLLRAAMGLHPAGRALQIGMAAAPYLLNKLASSTATSPTEKRQRQDLAGDQASMALIGLAGGAPAVLGAGGRAAGWAGKNILRRGRNMGKARGTAMNLQDDVAKNLDGTPTPTSGTLTPTPAPTSTPTTPDPKSWEGGYTRMFDKQGNVKQPVRPGKRVFGKEASELEAAGFDEASRGVTWEVAKKGPWKGSAVNIETGNLIDDVTEVYRRGQRFSEDTSRMAHKMRDAIQDLATSEGNLDVTKVAEMFKDLNFKKKKNREALQAALENLGLGGSPEGRNSIYEAIARKMDESAKGVRRLTRNRGANPRPTGRAVE